MTDDDVPAVNVSRSTLNLTEGGSSAFFVTLNSVPTGDVTVTLTTSGTGHASVTPSTTSLTFTSSNYDTPQIVDVSADQDDDALANTITLTLDPSGADYATVGNTLVTVNVTDNDTYGYSLTPDTLTIEEGTGGSFTVAMTAAPRVDTTVTLSSSITYVTIDTDSTTTGNQNTLVFTSTDWNSPKTVMLGAAQDSNDVSESATISLSASITGAGSVTGSLSVTVNDDDEPNLLLSESALTATEGGNDTFTVRLTVLPTANVTVTLSQPLNPNDDVTFDTNGTIGGNQNTLTFTTADWQTPKSVTVAAADDDDALPDSANIVLSSTGGNYDDVTRSISLSVTDGDRPGLEVSGSSLTINEGASGTFTVKLDTRPAGNVAVALSQSGTVNSEVIYHPGALIFTPGTWDTTQSVTVISLHDDDSANGSATLNLRAVGGEYDPVRGSVTVTVTDDDMQAFRLSDSALSLDEGDSETFTVELTTEPSADVTVTLARATGGSSDVNFSPTSLTFTTSNWDTPQSVTVSADADSDTVQDTATINLTASGGGYGSVTGSLSVTVNEDGGVAMGLALSASSLTVSEGTDITFTVALTTQPSAAVTVNLARAAGGSTDVTFTPASLSFTTSNWGTPQTVTVTGSEDDDTVQDNATINLTASGGGYDSATGSVSVASPDNDGVQLRLSESALRPVEGSNATFTVRLATQPSANVTVTLTKTGSDDVTVDTDTSTTGDQNTLAFTTSDWSTPQTVTVSADDDADALADAASIALTASGGGYARAAGSLSVSVIENDETGLTLSPDGLLTVDESSNRMFTVVLDTQPSAAVTVTLTPSGSGDVTVDTDASTTGDQNTLDFTTSNWGTPQTVTVSAADDTDTVRDDAVISLSATGGDYAGETGALSVSVIDNDAPGLTLSTSDVTVAENADSSFTVRLNTVPSATVTVSVAQHGATISEVSIDTDTVASGNQSALTFTTTDWQTPKSVKVAAADDANALDEDVTLRLTATGADYGSVSRDVAVTVTDDDDADLTLSTNSLALSEGATSQLMVKLATQPSETVTVSLGVTGSSGVTLSAASLVFTASNWSGNQGVTVSAAHDDDGSNESATISVSAVGGDYAGQADSVSVTVTDDDTAELRLSPGSLKIAEGGSKLFTVALATQPSASVTVTPSQSGTSNPDVTFSPSSLSFTADSWGTVQTVVVSADDDSDSADDTATLTLTAAGGDYASVTSTLGVTVTDDDMPGLTLSPGTLRLNEGSSGSFTAVLDTQPSGSVTVNVTNSGAAVLTLGSSSLTFTASDWNTPKTVTVTATEDDNAVRDTGAISLGASGGGYAGVGGALSVSVTDNDTTDLRLSESALVMDEGDSETFTVRLSAQPSASVTVNLGVDSPTDVTLSPSSLTFTTSNWSTAQDVTVTAGQDDDTADDSTSVSLTATGGGFGSASASLSVKVEDDDAPALTLSTDSLSVNENGSGTFTAALAYRPSGPVTVGVARGSGPVSVTASPATLSFTASTWSTAQTVTVSAADDPDSLDEEAEISLTATGGGYAGVSGSVSVEVDDDDTSGLTLSRNSLTMSEGTSVSFTAVLDTRPSGTVTVSLSAGGSSDVTLSGSALIFTTSTWGTAQTVTVSAAQDDDAINDSARVGLTAIGGGYAGITGSVTVSVTDDDAVGLGISTGSLTIDEGGSESLTVALATQPSANVTVSLTQHGVSNPDIGVTPAALVFTPSNWSTARTVSVRAAEDDDALADSATLRLRASGGGYGSATGSVTVEVTENDSVSLILSEDELDLDEGEDGSFAVSLATQPSSTVTVTLSRSGSGDVSLGSTSLSFTTSSWSAPQSVAVSVDEDDDALADSATISAQASGGDYGSVSDSVSVKVDDNDTAALRLSTDSLSLAEGGGRQFTVALATLPSSSVTVDLTRSGSSDVSITPVQLTFTTSNWGTERTVSVNAAEDDDTEADRADISVSASGGDYGGVSESVTVSVVDNDAVGLVLSASTLGVAEGGNASFTAALATQPSGNVTVNLSQTGTANPDVTLSASSLSFTSGNWNVAQGVTVSAAQDDDALTDRATIRASATGGGYGGETGAVSVTVTEDDRAALTLSTGSLSLSEGASGSFTVRLATQPSGGVTVNLAGSGDSDVTFDSPSLVFTTSNWGTVQTVNVSSERDADSADDSAKISLSASGGSYGGVIGSVTVTVDDDDAPGLDISESSLTLDENASASFTVALDTRPSGTVTVTLGQSSPANPDVSVSPASLSFTGSNWSSVQMVTVSAVQDADAVDDSATVTASATGGGYAGASGSVSVTVTDGDQTGLVVSKSALRFSEGSSEGFTVRLRTQPSGTVTVTVSQSGTANPDVALSASSLSFTASDWNVGKAVTASASQDDDASDDAAGISLSATGGGYSGATGSVSVEVTDNDSTGLSVSTDGVTMAEGSSGTFTVSLATQPSGTVTVTVSQTGTANPDVTLSASSLSFTASSWGTAQTVTVSAARDDDALADAATIGLSATGGGYDDESGSVGVKVTDGDSPALTLSKSDLPLGEGANGSFTVALATRPSGAVSVNLSVSGSNDVTLDKTLLSFSTSNWDTAQTVTVNAARDADAQQDRATVSLSATGADYGEVTGSVKVTVSDSSSIGLVLSDQTLDISEGGSGSFTVRLNTQPSAGVTVTPSQSGTANPDVTLSPASLSFTVSNWSSVQRVTVNAARDDDALQDLSTVLLTATGGDYAGATGSVSVKVGDLDEAALDVSASSLPLGEGGSGNFTVKLATRPSADVTVDLTRSGSAGVSVSPGSLTFTTGNWSATQSVTVTAGQDTDAVDERATISLSATGGDYGSATGSVTVSVTDDEMAGLTLSAGSAMLDEGDSAQFTVALATQPSAAVTVNLTQPANTDVTADTDADMTGIQSSLSFTASNWSTPQAVVIRAGDDDDAVDDTATISLTATGGDYAGLTGRVRVDVDDDDEVGIRVLPSPVTVREGGNSTRMRVALDTQPSAAVTLTLSQTGAINNDVTFDTDNSQAGSQATLSFSTSNWSQLQAVEISASQDADSLNDSASILLSAQGGDYAMVRRTVSVSVTDDDRPNLVVSQSELKVDEGATTSFTVVLSTRPSAGVTVTLTAPAGGEVTLDGDAVLSGLQGTVVFTDQNWNQARVVTVGTAHDDDGIDDIHTLGLAVSAGATEYTGASAGVTLTVEDDETPGISVTPASLNVGEGASANLGVALTSEPTSNVVVSIAQAVNADIQFDTDAIAPGSQSVLRFSPQNWETAQTVVVSGLQDADSQNDEEALRLTSSGAGYEGKQATARVTVVDDDKPGLVLSRNGAPLTGAVSLGEGASAGIGLRLVSRPSGPVQVSLSSNDTGAVTVSPAVLNFTRNNWSTVQTFTVTGAQDADSVDETARVGLTASGADYDDRTASVEVTVADDERAGLNTSVNELSVDEGGSTVFRVTLNNQPVGDVTVDLSATGGAVTVSPVQLIFTQDAWSSGREVTVSGVQDDDRQDAEDQIRMSASGGGYDQITKSIDVAVRDDDIASLVLSAQGLNILEGGSASFVVSLSVQPSDSVAVTIAGIDASSILCIPDRLSFTRENWTQPQVVTVVGLEDEDAQDDESTLSLLGSGADYEGVTAQLPVTVIDNDDVVTEQEIQAAESVLEEFGRVLLGSSVNVIARRFDALPGGSASADVGGDEVEVGSEGAFERMLQGAARHFGGSAPTVDAQGAHSTDHLMRLGSIRLQDGRPLRAERESSGRRSPLLREFTYPITGPGGETTAWMRFNQADFSGRLRDLGQDYDGSQNGIWVGIDQRFGNGVLFGAAVSESSGDAQYALSSDTPEISMDTSLLMVMPYLEIPVQDGILSLILGSGGGEIKSVEADGSKSKAYLSVQMFSLGTKWPLTRLGERVALSLMGSIGSSRLGSSCSSTEVPLCGLNSSGGRMSVGVELTHGEFGSTWRVTPRYALNLRQDSGSQSKGGGMEFSGAARISAPGDRFSVDVGLNWLAMHATEAYEEWSGSVELQLRSRDEAGRGLTLGLGPQWGTGQSDVLQREGLLGSDTRELARLRGEAGRMAMRASAGYGLDLWAGLLTPFAEYSVSEGEYASSRLVGGLRYRSRETLEARLFGELETGQGIQPRSRIGLELNKRF